MMEKISFLNFVPPCNLHLHFTFGQLFSTPPGNLFTSYDLSFCHEVSVGTGLPPSENGRMSCPEGPGLGIIVDEDKLGKPVIVI